MQVVAYSFHSVGEPSCICPKTAIRPTNKPRLVDFDVAVPKVSESERNNGVGLLHHVSCVDKFTVHVPPDRVRQLLV